MPKPALKRISGLVTPMRYPGAKINLFEEKIAPAMADYVPNNLVYVEPFAGGGSTVCGFLNFFSPKQIIVNDLSETAVAFWKCVKDSTLSKQLAERVKTTPITVATFAKLDRQLKAKQLTSTIDLGFAALYLGWTCHRGMIHKAGPVGGKNQDNPRQKIDKFYDPDVVSRRILELHESVWDRLIVTNCDFAEIIKKYDQPNVVMYVDPPYPGVGEGFYEHDMTGGNHHERLAEVLHGVKHAFIALSYGDHPTIRKLYKNGIKTILDKDVICFDGTIRKRMTEVLILLNAHKRTIKAPPVVRNPNPEVSPAEKRQIKEELAKHEAIISQGLKAFVAVGDALRKVSDDLLYRCDFTTFEEYAEKRWGLRRAEAYRKMKCAEAFHNVSKLETKILPANQGQVAPLVGIDPREQRKAWMLAVKNAGGQQPTGQVVLRAVRDLHGIEEPPETALHVKLAKQMNKLGYDPQLALRAAQIVGNMIGKPIDFEADDPRPVMDAFEWTANDMEELIQTLPIYAVAEEDDRPTEALLDKDNREELIGRVRQHAERLITLLESAETEEHYSGRHRGGDSSEDEGS